MPYTSLNAEAIAATIELLCRRVDTRFRDSGLARVCRELDGIARRTAATTAWISRPILPLRIAVTIFVAVILGALAASFLSLRPAVGPLTLSDLVQGIEAGINDVILLGAAVFSLVTIEGRVKRRRALKAIHELRSLAHVIDMHQLTKDPEWVLDRGRESGVLAPRTMSAFELSRYLDYCSEALSLAGKIAALYIQRFHDPVALAAVNEVEELTTSLSRKIWQKLMVLYTTERADVAQLPR